MKVIFILQHPEQFPIKNSVNFGNFLKEYVKNEPTSGELKEFLNRKLSRAKQSLKLADKFTTSHSQFLKLVNPNIDFDGTSPIN